MDSPSRRLPALAAALACALALGGGCAAIAPRDGRLPAVAVPAAWSAGSDRSSTPPAADAADPSAPASPSTSPAASPAAPARAASLADWWRNFDDAELAALVVRALEANTSLRSAQAALDQARAIRDVQAAGLLPSLDGSGAAQRARPAGGDASNSFRAALDASWEIDVFGRNRSAVQAAEADTRAAQASLADTQVSLAAEVALAYIQLRGLQSLLAIARSNLASQLETLQLVRWRAQAGLTTSVEVEQARAASEQTAAQIPSLESGLAQARHGLEVLTGQAPGALRSTLAEARPVPEPAGDLAVGIPAETLRQRPDVRRAEEQVSAALSRVSQAEAARYPSFRLGGALGLSAATLGGSAAVFDSLLASVTVPLFDGGAARAQVRAQEAALEQSRVGYEAVVLNALKEVEDALVSLDGNRRQLARLRNAADAAANAALLAQHRYASGLIDFQVVLDTQRTLLTTQERVAGTTTSVSTDHVRLYKALGGGWK